MGRNGARLLFGVALALAGSVSPAVCGGVSREASAASATDAFVAVFGPSAPVTRQVSRPENPSCCRTVTLAVTPGDLVDLGGGRYALVSLETNPLGSHAETGALSIAYLDRQGPTWQVEHVWNEFAWTGDTGIPADSLQDLKPPRAAPMVFALRQGVWQGDEITTAWAIKLEPKGPHLAGQFNAGGELDADNGCSFSTCGAWAYIAGIGRPSAPHALFSVAYGGWREAPGVHRPSPFAVVTKYVERGGGLVAVPPVKLPGS
jgi:hypothetical protein